MHTLYNTRLLVIPILLGIATTLGCESRPNINLRDDEIALRDSILSVLAGADQSAIRSAFEKLPDYSFTRYIRTEQYNEDDFMVAYNEHVVRITDDGEIRQTEIVQADSAGTFEFGFFKRFVSENLEEVDPEDLVPYVLPDDLGYNSPRNRDRYSFHFLSDTLMWDRQAQVIEARARPGLADGLNVRRVRHYIDRGTNVLVAVYLVRIDLAMLFREESDFYVHVQPTEFGEFLPYNTRFETTIKTPFRDAYRIRTVSTYTEYERISEH